MLLKVIHTRYTTLCPDIHMSVLTAEFVVTCARQPSTASPDQIQTALSSCCVQELEDWVSTWLQQIPASSLTLTGILRMTCRYRPHHALSAVFLVYNDSSSTEGTFDSLQHVTIEAIVLECPYQLLGWVWVMEWWLCAGWTLLAAFSSGPLGCIISPVL